MEHVFRFGFDLVYREQLDSLMKLKWPLLACENVPWALHTPLCTLQSWSPAGLILDSSFSAGMVGEATNFVDMDLDRRSVTSWEVESAREDGELPTALPVATMSVNSSLGLPNESFQHAEHSRSLALISKNVTPTKMVKTRSFSKYEDELELIFDSESDLEEQACVDQLTENMTSIVCKPWEDHAAREFDLVLSRTCGNDRIIKLNAKVNHQFSFSFCTLFIVIANSLLNDLDNLTGQDKRGIPS